MIPISLEFAHNIYLIMNIRLLKDSWRKYYKRGFITGIVVLSFICLIDQTLKTPFFFNKIDGLGILMFTLSFIFFGSVFCGILSLAILAILSFATVSKN